MVESALERGGPRGGERSEDTALKTPYCVNTFIRLILF